MLSSVIRVYRDAFRGLPREVWMISLALMVNRSGTMVLPFLSLYCTSQLDMTPATTGGLIGLYGAGGILGCYLGGRLSTVIGAIRVQVGSLFLTAPAFLLVLASKDVWTLGAALTCLSIVAESLRPASATATTQFCPESLHPKALALNRLAVNLGLSIGPVLGGFLAARNFALLFLVDAATSLLAGFALLALFRRAPPRALDAAHFEQSHQSPWTDRRFAWFLCLTMLQATAFFQFAGSFPLYLKNHQQLDETHIGLLISINTAMIVLLEMVLVNRISRLSLLRSIGWGSFLVCLGFGLLPWGRGFLFCIATVVVWTFGEMLVAPLTGAYVARISTPANRGSYMGMYTMAYSVSFVLAPLWGLPMYGWHPNGVWHVCLVMGVVVLFGFGLLARQDSRTPNNT